MSQAWDKRGVAFDPETWRRIAIPLKPGGYLIAFGGTRTYHRMACAIEDAGFVIQDTIAWVYGSGLPKGKTLLKPAFEPIVLAYKPGNKRKLQIDECRIKTERDINLSISRKGERTAEQRYTDRGSTNFAVKPGVRGGSPDGRWPANLCHDGSDEVMMLFPDTKSGSRKAGFHLEAGGNGLYGKFKKKLLPAIIVDNGSAARFFYCAKADKIDRAGSKHPTIKPQALMRWLVALVTPPRGTVLDPFGGSGSTAQAALAVDRIVILIENEEQWFKDSVARLMTYKKEHGGR
jgi:site-specific DNA-methyltransferase (adenine-specific)